MRGRSSPRPRWRASMGTTRTTTGQRTCEVLHRGGTQGVALSAAEEKLAALLVENGVIQKTASGYSPGEGCVISISRGSSPVLRDLLLTHECFHGAFFSLPAFREATEKEWASLSPVEQQVWKDFLASRSYNVEDHYLLVNEFQSYLLQQERLYVSGFQAITLGGCAQPRRRARRW